MTEGGKARRSPTLWLFGSVFLVVGLAVAWWMLHAVANRKHRPGDGRNPETYGFSLGNFSLDRAVLVASGLPRDGIEALVDPGFLARDAVPTLGRRFLLPSDPVAGVVMSGQARAYPLRVLVFHELVNDTLGGEPVLVVHQPLCGLTAVFSRKLEGRVLTFGHSGLLWSSCGLAYDRESQSLWLPLAGRAVAGPAVGQELRFLPFTLTTWERWQHQHPGTTVLEPDTSRLAQYRRDPYSSYLGSEILRFPVKPSLPEGLRPKAPLLVFDPGGRPLVVLLETGRLELSELRLSGSGEKRVNVVPVGHPPVWEVIPSPAGDLPPVLYAFAFAWYALHPEPTPDTWTRVSNSRPPSL